MITEIRGVEFDNKGAELMLHAVVQKMSEWNDKNIVAIRPKIGSFRQRSPLGLYQLIWSDKKFPLFGSSLNSLLNLIPEKTKNSFGLVTYSQIDVVLDASGFTYSDQWGSKKSQVMADLAKKCRKEGKKVILMPQAFGPFENPQVKKAFIEVVKNTDLIFAREAISYKYLMELGIESSHIKIAPDFTNLVKGTVPDYFDTSFKRACIIPNIRMTDKTSEEVKNRYIYFLETCADILFQKELKPFILVHDTEDSSLAFRIQEKFGNSLEIISESNPLYIKGILGNCYAVVSSRFHGLINALSQGIPCVATGWSHKYQMLLEDYNCPECLIDSVSSKDEIKQKINMITDEPHRSLLLKKLEVASIEQKKLVSNMWDEIYNILSN
ncbi:polysaccharide pyruvyl transferase family protein [Calothrix sp. FACHB-1219]|uniref:polysaccharide pyruvyl transferase family protein n=1 Tax=unclassified Calothrix TaxID=2619626 RepID=UPI00168777CF|nr:MULTISPECIES: polysaccharide pyruvyl transferase family protein [unclassified Calothrix]MBD2205070.1 polysaccharide pyruvyl transferase family protein [Calothrix sp. FACHB-168]MBD2219868.1 polysaccharide pyruvyl transferase family protein [Calothrix sp. FACHB-1219]